MPLILLSGLPGSGKTTFALAVAARASALHIESDAIRRSLIAKPRYTRQEHRRVFAKVERLLAEGLAAGRLVILDATNLREGFRAIYLAMAEAHHQHTVCVTLTAPLDTLRRRVSGQREGHSQADTTVLNGMLRDVERFRRPSLIVDTRFDIEPSVQLAITLAGVQT